MTMDPIDAAIAEPPEHSLAEPDDGALLGHIYDVAIAPERIDALVAYWVARIEKGNGRRTHRNSAPNEFPREALPHLDRAESILRAELRERQSELNSVNAWVNNKRHAAFALNSEGIVIAANTAVNKAFGVQEGANVRDILVDGPNRGAACLPWPPREPSKLAWLFTKPHGEAHAATLSSQILEGSDCTGVTVNFIEWPNELSSLLSSTYGLTSAEIEVLKILTGGLSVKKAAELTNRSTATLRSHVGSMLDKTETRSQLELIRLCIGLMTITVTAPADAPAAYASGKSASNGRRANAYKTVKLSDGRNVAYLETGDPNGRNFLLLPGPLGLFRFPRAIEEEFARQGLRMIVPLRATLGPSSIPPKGRPIIDTLAADTLELMTALNIKKAPVVCIWTDILNGLILANRQPDRITAVIGASAVLPVTEPQHMARLDPMGRFVFSNTRSSPKITNIVGLAFLYLAHIAGPERQLRSVFKTSPVDLALLDNAELCEALTMGLPTLNLPHYAAHEACHREIEAFVGDWRSALVNCKSPVILMTGDSSASISVETMYDFAARSANITPIVVKNTGMLVMHQHPDAVIAEVKKWL
jgi:pimeloyl-ACP methyl ester carboxylesterase/DNA-binding CsgD family transcriptional regulator